jgi:6-phosphogluconolactonase
MISSGGRPGRSGGGPVSAGLPAPGRIDTSPGMKSRWFHLQSLWAVIAFLALAGPLQPAAADRYTVYAGTYTGATSKGIYAFAFDAATGKTGEPRLVAETPSPSFLALHPRGTVLYAVNEVNEINGEPGGGLSAFRILPDGGLHLLNQASTAGAGPCHLAVDSQGRVVMAVNYGGGSTVSHQLEADGRLGQRASFIQHSGSSVNQRRQEGPHAHGIYLSANDRFAYVPDLGLDKVLIYRLERETGVLTVNDPPAGIVPPGSGPRHFALHPKLAYAWSLNELLSTVTTFKVNANTGALEPLSTVSTLPAGFEGNNSTAEIFVHPGGRLVYASNRGHDSIAVFRLDESTGALTLIQNQPVGGRTKVEVPTPVSLVFRGL